MTCRTDIQCHGPISGSEVAARSLAGPPYLSGSIAQKADYLKLHTYSEAHLFRLLNPVCMRQLKIRPP